MRIGNDLFVTSTRDNGQLSFFTDFVLITRSYKYTCRSIIRKSFVQGEQIPRKYNNVTLNENRHSYSLYISIIFKKHYKCDYDS